MENYHLHRLVIPSPIKKALCKSQHHKPQSFTRNSLDIVHNGNKNNSRDSLAKYWRIQWSNNEIKLNWSSVQRTTNCYEYALYFELVVPRQTFEALWMKISRAQATKHGTICPFQRKWDDLISAQILVKRNTIKTSAI